MERMDMHSRNQYLGILRGRYLKARVWEVFDYPCGQRLKPVLEVEVGRLRQLGELKVSDEVALKLKRMSSTTLLTQAAVKESVVLRSSLMPGPIVVVRKALLTY